MRTTYSTRLGRHRIAIADVCPIENDTVFILTRINVPIGFRGEGHGTALLERVLEDADFEGKILRLEINPYGDLSYDDLRLWYERHGFEEIGDNLFERKPE